MKKTYTAHVDYKANTGKMFGHFTLAADNLLDAMSEAEQYLTDEAYLVTISENEKTLSIHKEWKETLHNEILTNRGNGWHRTDESHSERQICWKETIFKKGYAPDWEIYVVA